MTRNSDHPRSTFNVFNTLNRMERTVVDKVNRLQFHINRGSGIIKQKLLTGSWFRTERYSSDPTSPSFNKYKVNPKRSRRSEGISLYSSDSDESDGEKESWFQSLKKKEKRYFAEWLLKKLESETEKIQLGFKQTDKRMTRTSFTQQKVTQVALTSRLILLALQVVLTNFYGYAKHENDGFKFTPEAGYGTTVDKVVNTTLGGFTNWDGQYFLHIAVHGYTRENTLAFFPLFPMTLYLISKVLYLIFGFIMSLSSIVIVVGWILNTVCFVKTANVLYQVTQYVDSDLAPLTVFLFCFNPASVFFSSLYTESLFALLSTKVILALYERKIVAAMTYASLSSICRSNGLLNFGFIAFFLMDDSFRATRGNIYATLLDVIRQCSVIVIGLIPFLQFQGFAIWKFCNRKAFKEGNYRKPPPYCNLETLPYSYIQKRYWDVGFMNYFEVKQIPNFLLAFPVLYFLLTESWRRFAPLLLASIQARSPRAIFPTYVAFHGIFLAFYCFFNVHVQVSTRLILASFPYFYIYLAETSRNETFLYRRKLIDWPVRSTCVNFWCLFYFIVGGIAFPLGYPWT